MKNIEALEKRGYVEDIKLEDYKQLQIEKLYQQLDSSLPIERTIAVRLLSRKIGNNDTFFIRKLLNMLEKESALYTKLEICQVLENGNRDTCKMMCEYLGKIGRNQYHSIPDVVSKKISYPLPRDIIARVMGRMNPESIDIMELILKDKDVSKISEVLDAIGFMIFYHQELNSMTHFLKIKEVIETHLENELIVWKGILCLSAFWREECKTYLQTLKICIQNPKLMLQLDRSLSLVIKHIEREK